MRGFAFSAVVISIACLLPGLRPARAEEIDQFAPLRTSFDSGVLPLLRQFCVDCHSTADREGELDLERVGTFADVRRDPAAWQKVRRMLRDGEMPPADSPQLSREQMRQLTEWVSRYLDTEARARAGDPGPVVLRRLNNSEYTWTIRDLTGVKSLDPARQFPTDGAAGEGFTNTGQALAMSPALVQKYLDAAREIAGHAVLLPDGFRFSPSSTRRDWADEILAEIRSIYTRHTKSAQLAGVRFYSQQEIEKARKVMAEDGRVDLVPYFAALVEHRESIEAGRFSAETVAKERHLNPKYLGILAATLTSDDVTPLLRSLQNQWRAAGPEEASALAEAVRAWQDRLWRFQPVGHLGLVQPWQVPSVPLEEQRHLRLPLSVAPGADAATIFLIASPAGDGAEGDLVAWQNARIEFGAGKPVIPLRDLRALSIAMDQVRFDTFSRLSEYLAVAWHLKDQDQLDVEAVASERRLRPDVLRSLLVYLGIAAGDDVQISEYLQQPLNSVGGYSFVRGWGQPGLDALSVVANSSDQAVAIPGDMQPHQVAVHPRPERWVATGWKSPVDGTVRVSARVRHAHAACGNGVSWKVELRRSATRRVLAAGNVDRVRTADIPPVDGVQVRKGDLISLIIGPRDGSHVCDLTEIDLTIVSESDDARLWSLSTDCADSIDAGNPHPDRYGHRDTWHFYHGRIDGEATPGIIPADSLLGRWLDANDAAAASEIAEQLQRQLLGQASGDVSDADHRLAAELRSLQGPLFGRIDLTRLAETVSREELTTSTFGIDPERFGRHPDGSAAPEDALIVHAPEVIDVRVPASLCEGAELVVTGTLAGPASGEGSVQLAIAQRSPRAAGLADLLPGVPVTARAGTTAEERVRTAFNDFRAIFPAAMCHARVVPIDEVVTLVLYHREDEHLARLMLSEAEQARLDRLWGELFYVSQDAFRLETALEQILEFATQDADPRKFDPVLQPIAERAEAFRRQLLATEPVHVDSLLKFADRAWRRPLTESERKALEAFYRNLRSQQIDHEDAFRLTLARILASPAFLYRLEEPRAGSDPNEVTPHELASRLSYFLWSSMPDAELRAAADGGGITSPEVLRAHSQRMLNDPRTRRLAIEFACQWLGIRDFDQLDEKSPRHFPEFAALQDDMYEESIRFFENLFRNDGSILEILSADYTFVNSELATFYGIPDIPESGWRRVESVDRFGRGGILGQASTLARQSGASRTSPILRGNWISETLLGERLPRPPDDVPQLPETVPEGLSERQLIERHSSDPACVKCHARIDPYGFALENFDAIGRFRTRDARDHPIDTRTTLPDGTSLDGLSGLREYLLTKRRDDFVRVFCRKLLGYALGRRILLSDEPLLDEMMAALAANEYRFSVAVETVVLSPQFRMIRGRDATDTPLAKEAASDASP
ncbi:hypothetical protein Mal4_00050 [Maioricimonas rarisocia]|uniref:Planctomycete cytochrome C n=1 Tax=Maioricimonas rarisocia TaxID=2528026 RepID=A0A517YZW4_9PLAN|nr:DUF1592 domain-containing protein [Maioricimonas rarisocia]QDU35723.1 hypothetical protein Mal4_00050 [Maioricimonas rarisocia]